MNPPASVFPIFLFLSRTFPTPIASRPGRAVGLWGLFPHNPPNQVLTKICVMALHDRYSVFLLKIHSRVYS
ncbi:hypothetical protein OG21DRAFT_1337682 [Imleria badia]|nr:hypothetical protein OG21DRAFT_1337682 [Imleria badia]